jgi:transcriptional regulator with GAF, ATPase, and Fis domain
LLVLFSEGETIGLEDLPRALRTSEPATAPYRPVLFAQAVADYEKKLLAEAISQSGGVKAEAARRLGLDTNQIKYLCRKYGL